MTYYTSADKIVRKKTIAVFMIFAAIPLFSLILLERWIWEISLFGFFMLILLYTYLHKPTRYEVRDEKIIIRRPIGNVEINLQEIARIDPIHHDLLKDATKGGAFGYMGKFDTYLGKTMWYGTRRDQIVLITKTDGSKIVLTPDQREEFIEQVSSTLRSLSATTRKTSIS